MAEWSKALVLGTSLFGGVGSNPTSVTILHRSGGLAQSVECVVRNDEAPGSKPGFSTFLVTDPGGGSLPWPPLGSSIGRAGDCSSSGRWFESIPRDPPTFYQVVGGAKPKRIPRPGVEPGSHG